MAPAHNALFAGTCLRWRSTLFRGGPQERGSRRSVAPDCAGSSAPDVFSTVGKATRRRGGAVLVSLAQASPAAGQTLPLPPPQAPGRGRRTESTLKTSKESLQDNEDRAIRSKEECSGYDQEKAREERTRPRT